MNKLSTKSLRPSPKSHSYGKEVHIGLKAAFSLIKKSMNESLYMTAYVTAFSIVEDRLFAMYVVAKRTTEGVKDVRRDFRVSMLSYVDYLVENNHLEQSMKSSLKKQFDLRNKRFHGAMWRLHEFTEMNTQTVIDLARKMTDLRKAQKKRYGNGL